MVVVVALVEVPEALIVVGVVVVVVVVVVLVRLDALSMLLTALLRAACDTSDCSFILGTAHDISDCSLVQLRL